MSSTEQSLPHLLRFQIGPVQDFIAQARNTRDLWSGSFLLSWLAATGIRHLRKQRGAEFIFPNPEHQPLLNELFRAKDLKTLLTPSLPNIFVALLREGDARQIAKETADAITREWKNIATAVWDEGRSLGLRDRVKERFDSQVDRHLSITWQATPVTGDDLPAYPRDYRLNSRQLDAVRQTRDFRAWNSGGWQTTDCEKDSLSGREEAVVGGPDWHDSVSERYQRFFKHPNDHLGAVNLIKRVWHQAYLSKKEAFAEPIQKFKIRSTLAIASRGKQTSDDEDVSLTTSEKYLAAIAFDGDSMGKWMSGEFLEEEADLRGHHRAFSTCLSHFATNKVRDIVEKDHAGFLIYAGGDDVVALVPADEALACSRAIREAFRAATAEIQGRDQDKRPIQPDASAGIAIAHYKTPLQDLIRAAQAAEKKAKNNGRSAFSVTLMKRSGEGETWGAKWDSGGLELHEDISAAMSQGHLSGRFPHRVSELLEPYQTVDSHTGRYPNDPHFKAHSIISLEFAHVLDRQNPGKTALPLATDLTRYLQKIGDDPQTCLRDVIGLCKTVVFTRRNRAPSASLTPQD
ncbi:CRISPR-associated protein, Cmr2 family [Prosthecobacter debontii]|uniref:CRISPR-associated protein, Cmr2 family n=1 Tax=Prosthecobacter debontii TaxID=48467 RepID=A0A1T4YK97_9BACT|nr:type III-B CRISPR-associated protein Cas10/Cmr2 [Prosthecobacter debontii]SKB01681.1 CRISPR-associated protein, Cmr2 family [Prosthecobacter debontii]